MLLDGGIVFYLESDGFPFEQPLDILPDPEQPGFLYVGTEHCVYHGSLEQDFDSWDILEIAPLQTSECLESINGQIWICARTGSP